jgi:hypothetical protein
MGPRGWQFCPNHDASPSEKKRQHCGQKLTQLLAFVLEAMCCIHYKWTNTIRQEQSVQGGGQIQDLEVRCNQLFLNIFWHNSQFISEQQERLKSEDMVKVLHIYGNCNSATIIWVKWLENIQRRIKKCYPLGIKMRSMPNIVDSKWSWARWPLFVVTLVPR